MIHTILLPLLSILTVGSTAEVSSGLICVCIPTLAALGHRRPLKPATSILNSRCTKFSGRKGPSSLDEENLFDKGDLELGERRFSSACNQVPLSAVITGIKGGPESLRKQEGHLTTQEIELTDSGEDLEVSARGSDIIKTVRIEHSYA